MADVVHERINGRRLIFLGPTLMTSAAKAQELGARCLLVAVEGRVPSDFPAEVVELRLNELHKIMVGGDGGLETWRVLDEESRRDRLRIRLQERFDSFDPAQNAILVAPSSATLPGLVDGRVVWGSRARGVDALEDKTRVDAEVFDPAEVARVPGEVVNSHKKFDALFDRYDHGNGLVMTVDGVTISSQHVRFVTSPTQAALELESIQQDIEHSRVRRVRFSTFEPRPSGTAGFLALPDRQILTFSAIENMVVQVRRPFSANELLDNRNAGRRTMFGGHLLRDLEDATTIRLEMIGLNGNWDPSPAAHQAMRQNSYKTGRYVNATKGYCGPGGVDQLVGDRDALAHEFNPRFAYGFVLLDRALPVEYPLGLFSAMVVSHHNIWGAGYFPTIDGEHVQGVVRGAVGRSPSPATFRVARSYGNRVWRFQFEKDGQPRLADTGHDADAITVSSRPVQGGSILHVVGLEKVSGGRPMTGFATDVFSAWAEAEHYPHTKLPASLGPRAWDADHHLRSPPSLATGRETAFGYQSLAKLPTLPVD